MTMPYSSTSSPGRMTIGRYGAEDLTAARLVGDRAIES
jgi:hypothetical protein